MKRLIMPMIVLSILISSCSLSRQTSTPSPEDIKTQVAVLMTQVASTQGVPTGGDVTQLPTIIMTATQAPTQPPVATPTLIPTNTPPPATSTATNTPIVTAVPTTSNTATLAPTSTPITGSTPIGTPIAGDPRSKLGTPTFKDTFSTEDNWATGEDKFTKMVISNQTLQFTGLSTIDGWRLTWPKVKDFYLEATIQPGTCSGSDRYGLIARVPDIKTADQGYLVGVTCDGRYSLRKWDGKNMTSLIDWTQSTAIQTAAGKSNRVGLLAIGDQLTVYVNGTALKSVKDSSFTEGGFGLFVGANKTTNFTITVTEVDMWENPNL